MKFRKPMLAKTFESNQHRVVYPCYAQPKLDGVRCLTDGQRFWSRDGNLFPSINIKHLQVPHVSFLVDGELFIEDAPFEDIISAVKHASNDDRTMSKQLRFNVFDVVTPEPFYIRRIRTVTVVQDALLNGAKWKSVFTERITSREHLERFAKKMLRLGCEGTIIRSRTGKYVPRRSVDVLKYKPLMDAEFEIVGVKEAQGKDKGTPIFVCCDENYDGPTFRVRPMGTTAQRRKMWKNRNKLLGMMLTVEYQNLTKYGVPRFPRAKVLRDYE